MSATTKKIEKTEKANVQDQEIQQLLDSLNASVAIQNVSTQRNFSTDRIWKKTFRDSQKNGKISSSVRNKMSGYFGRIANFVKSGKMDSAKQEFINLENWSKDKLTNLEFSKFSDYSNKDIVGNPEILKFGSDAYNRDADAINSGINAIKILRLKNII